MRHGNNKKEPKGFRTFVSSFYRGCSKGDRRDGTKGGENGEDILHTYERVPGIH